MSFNEVMELLKLLIAFGTFIIVLLTYIKNSSPPAKEYATILSVFA